MRCHDVIDSSRAHGLCDDCVLQIPWATDNPFSSYMDEFAFDDVWSVTRYGTHVRGMIHGLKLHGETYIAKNLGALMAERLLMEECAIDILTAVPLHKDKLRLRGFNQAALLGEYIAQGTGIVFLPGILIKPEPTPSLRLADSRTRRHILTGAFSVPEEYLKSVAGHHIVLVDDVCTTGTTADACAQALKCAGAVRVTLLCFAASAGYRTESVDES